MSSDKEERKSLLGSSGLASGHIRDPVGAIGKKSPPGSVSSVSSYGSMDSKAKYQPPIKGKYKSGGGMFRYATKYDYFLIFFGSLASFLHGAGWPLLSIVLGGMTDTFLRAQSSDFVTGANSTIVGNYNASVSPIGNQTVTAAGLPQISREEFEENVVLYCIYYAAIGVLMFFSSYIQIACWEMASERQVHRLRQSYFKSILRQEIGWFDSQQSGQLTTRLNDDLERVREGLGDKFSLFIQFVSAFLAGFIIGFIYDWRMTLVMMSLTPLIAATGAWMAKMTAGRTHVEQQKYAVAGGIAEETLTCIRTVLALNGQSREINRYEVALEDGRKTGLWKYFYMSVGFAVTFMCMFGSYALAFWFGSRLIVDDPTFDRGTIFTVFFAVMSGSSALGGALPHFGSISIAKGACKSILQVIDNQPTIDPYSVEGLRPAKVAGKIKLNNIKFSYPVRKDIPILKNVSLTVEPGTKIALVGSSGCGKSTIVNLLLRYYDPDQGSVTIDGHDVRNLNVEFLRKTIGVVSQEPVLFDGTLESNIRLGNDDVTHEQIIAATKQANAYKFINMLPQGLQTRVGERGVQLSGGQKQRIAIARAIVRNPKILLLDEATSALDTESEGLVQAALDQAQKGRTTLIVAHRLSTIRDATRIFVFSNGQIVEQGTHDELMATRGAFYKMVLAQQLDDGKEDHKATTEDEVEEKVDVLSTSSGNALTRRKTPEAGRYSRQASSNRRVSNYAESMVSNRSSSAQLKELVDAVDEHRIKPSSMTKIFMINRKAWKYLFAGLAGCLLSGTVMPAFALFYSQIFSVFSEPVEQLEGDAIFWSLMFLVLGVVQGGGFFISANMLGRSGENITKTMRLSAFSNLLRQDVTYFDDEKHGTGKICTRFATDAPNVRYVFTRLPMVVSSVVTVVAAIVIAFVFGWKLAFLLVAMVPLVIASGYFEMKMQFGKQMRDTEELEEAGKTASEAINNVRTVQALTREFTFFERYCDMLHGPFKQNLKQAHIYGLVFGFSQSIIFFMYAAAFRFGAFLVVQGDMMPLDVYRVFFAIAFCGQSVGQISSFIPDVVKARLAAALLFHMIEYEPNIDSLSPAGLRPDLKGAVQLKNVHFTYPTRPGAPVLQGLSLSVQPGQTLALVGPSGCGKSTVVSLLERFYDAQKGQIFIDGLNVKTLNLTSLRNQMGLVSQEPLLFDCTIRENIIYGLEGRVTHDQVVQAAKLANIHQFILTLPMGYDTKVGEKGTQLSGGQKQRIAIARALIRNPKILLLDEATSALDTESEKVVQEALDNARQGRTSIVIAHRLSTIQNADCIAVINEGKVVEKGTHAELLENKGLYYSLCQMQNLMDSQ